MKKTRIASLLATAVTAVAFAAPATASATEWTHNGQPIENTHSIETWGGMAFNWGSGSGFSCEAGFLADLFAGGDEGEITEFLFGGCNGAGPFSQCSIEQGEVSPSAPLRATQSGNIEIDNLDFALEFSGEKCYQPLQPWISYVGTWYFDNVDFTITPDDSEAMSTLTFSAVAEKVYRPNGNVSKYSGMSGQLEMALAGEYGILQG